MPSQLHLLLAALLLLSAFAVRDAALWRRLPRRDGRKALLVGEPLALFFLAAFAADAFSAPETAQWIASARLWTLIIAIHLALAFAVVRGRRQSASSVPLVALLHGPLLFAGAFAAVWLVLRQPWAGDGWIAGTVAAAAWLLVLAILVRAGAGWERRATDLVVYCHLASVAFFPAGSTPASITSLHDVLYVISNAFLLPTLLGTLLAFFYGLYIAGRFAGSWLEHRTNRRLLASLGPEPREDEFLRLPLRGAWERFRCGVAAHPAPAIREKLVADLEFDLSARLDELGIVAKVGPMLGLIGTLIPLQPALAGLARGDLQAMGANLQIGFTTTVIGLVVGGGCYAAGTLLRGWYQRDIADMQFLLALWEPPAGAPQPEAAPAAEALSGANHTGASRGSAPRQLRPL